MEQLDQIKQNASSITTAARQNFDGVKTYVTGAVGFGASLSLNDVNTILSVVLMFVSIIGVLVRLYKDLFQKKAD